MNYNYPWKAKLPQLRIYKNVFMKFDYTKMSKHRVSIVMIKLLRHDAHHHKLLTLQRYLCLSYQPPDMLPIFFQVWVIYLPLIIFVTSWSIILNVIYWFEIKRSYELDASKKTCSYLYKLIHLWKLKNVLNKITSCVNNLTGRVLMWYLCMQDFKNMCMKLILYTKIFVTNNKKIFKRICLLNC